MIDPLELAISELESLVDIVSGKGDFSIADRINRCISELEYKGIPRTSETFFNLRNENHSLKLRLSELQGKLAENHKDRNLYNRIVESYDSLQSDLVRFQNALTLVHVKALRDAEQNKSTLDENVIIQAKLPE